MHNWKSVRLGDLFTIKSSRRIYASEYVEQGVPFYRSKEIIAIRDGKKVKSENYISDKRFKEIHEQYGTPKKGDILITSVGTIGVVWLVDHEEFYFKDGNLNWIEASEDKVLGEFIYYWLDSSVGYSNIINQTIGTSQSALTIQNLNKLQVLLPDRVTMKKINDTLSSYDKILEKNNRRIAILEKTAKELYKEWFVRMRFPGAKETTFVKGLPKEWTVKKLINENCRLLSSGIEKFSGQKQYLATANVNNFSYDEGEVITYHDRPSRANMQPVENSIWFAKMQDSIKHIFATSFTKGLLNDYILSTGFAGIQCDELYFWYYLSFIRYGIFENIKDSFANGSTQVAINNQNIKRMNILLPDEETLQAFNEKTSRLFTLIYQYKQMNVNLQKQRDLLLPRLMNGTINIGSV